MSPYVTASAIYQREACSRTFEEDVAFHLMHGFVFSTPDYFIMGRPVSSQAHQSHITGQWVFSRDVCDCWHVFVLAGSITKAWDILPYDLPLMSYERGNDLRVLPLAVMRRLLSNHATSHALTTK